MSTLVCDRVKSSSQTVVENVPEALGYEPTNLPLEAKKERLQQIGNNTRFLIRTNTINAYLLGKNLYEARALFCDEKGRELKLCCDEGTEIGFVEWLRENAGMGLTNGYNYIKLARNYAFYFEPYLSQPEKWQELEKIIPNTNITALFMLSAPSVSEPARKESVAMLNAGEILTPDEARDLIDKYNTEKFTFEDKLDSENKDSQTVSIPQFWSESSSFKVTVNENLEVDVKFNSQYVDGVTKCHLFDFSGDVADSGIRSHYACYKEAHNYPSPQDYAQEVCEKLYQKLQAKRSNTPYHEFKQGDRVEVTKGKHKGIQTEVIELLTGKSRCILTGNGEFSPNQLQKLDHNAHLQSDKICGAGGELQVVELSCEQLKLERSPLNEPSVEIFPENLKPSDDFATNHDLYISAEEEYDSSFGKTRTTILLNDDIIEWFRERVYRVEGGDCQTLINNVLYKYIQHYKEPLNRQNLYE